MMVLLLCMTWIYRGVGKPSDILDNTQRVDIKNNPKFQISVLKFCQLPQLFVNAKKIPKNTKNKLGMSWAKLSRRLAI